jgi:O-antigen biosynthesis protein
MRILIVSPLPLHDRASGDLRLFRLLQSLVTKHDVDFCAVGSEWQLRDLGQTELERYRRELSGIGVKILREGVRPALRKRRHDQIWFEFYSSARPFIELTRAYQPHARIVVDTVDVHFVRMLAKAQLTGKKAAMARALEVKAQELEVYRRVDGLITVTDQDAEALTVAGIQTPAFTVPNVHAVHDPSRSSRSGGPRLIFVGSFRHGPNEDAMIYFCREVLPLITAQAPQTTLTIVGDAPSAAVRALTSEQVTVTGFVPETAPCLHAADISIAPLRFGAGMKGKIGEAMSFGLPVVTTSVGAEGFGLEPGRHLLLADDPRSFAAAVLQLHTDTALYEQIRIAGHSFIKDNYGPDAVGQRALLAVNQIGLLLPKSVRFLRKAGIRAGDLFDRYIAWRVPEFRQRR